ncbi:nematocyst expressed protein 3-like [Marmota monax]|uniref:nematocyst expressed protein 3-like n=1 Tax=Marmota monax TaxID=9995 RepID=UPI0026F1AF09|nr:nematocyst expressed protein 3-like [Marmota monax]
MMENLSEALPGPGPGLRRTALPGGSKTRVRPNAAPRRFLAGNGPYPRAAAAPPPAAAAAAAAAAHSARCPSGNATDRTGIPSTGARGTRDTPPPAAPLASPPTAPYPLASSPPISGSRRGRLEKRLCSGAPAPQRASARLLLEGKTVLMNGCVPVA